MRGISWLAENRMDFCSTECTWHFYPKELHCNSHNCVYSYEMLFIYPNHRITILNAWYFCDLNINKCIGCVAWASTTLREGRDWRDPSSLTEISCEQVLCEDNAFPVISYVIMQFSKLWLLLGRDQRIRKLCSLNNYFRCCVSNRGFFLT
jgi:hypothetical protein